MSGLETAQELLGRLSRAEKALVLQWTARDLGDAFPGIESRPGVCGGEPCIVRTRIQVWALEQARRLGNSEADLLRSYPILRAVDPRIACDPAGGRLTLHVDLSPRKSTILYTRGELRFSRWTRDTLLLVAWAAIG